LTDIVVAMPLAINAALEATIGLVLIFFVVFPVLAQGLIAFAIAQGLCERAENQRLAGRWGRKARERQEADRRL
jgi:hypothetical protein